MLRFTLPLTLAVLACAPTSDGAATAATAGQSGAPESGAGPVTLAYDPARAPGTYTLSFSLVAGETRINGAIGFELRPRSDARFDLFVTQLVEGNSDMNDPRMREHPLHDLSIDARGPADARLNPEGFLKNGSDLAESFMFLLPQTPSEPVQVGATWTGTRTLPMGKVIPEHPQVTIMHELVRLEHKLAKANARAARAEFLVDMQNKMAALLASEPEDETK